MIVDDIAELSSENQYNLGLFVGEMTLQAYLVAKGVRDIGLCHTYGITDQLVYDKVSEYISYFGQASGSRCVGYKRFTIARPGVQEEQIAVWAQHAQQRAERAICLLQSSERTPEFHLELGNLLGYSLQLIEEFINE